MVISLYNISSRYLGSYNKYSISLELTATHLQFNSHAFCFKFALQTFSIILSPFIEAPPKFSTFLDQPNTHFFLTLIRIKFK